MKFKFLLILPLVVFSACQKDDLTATVDKDDVAVYNDPADIVKGWVRIKLKESAESVKPAISTRGGVESGSLDFDRLAAELGAVEVKPVFTVGGRFEKRQRDWGLHLWYDIRFDEKIPVTRAMGGFSAIDEIAIAEPIPVIKQIKSHAVTPYLTRNTGGNITPYARDENYPFDDPGLPQQWHYNNAGNIPNSVEGADINLFAAWKETTGHPDVIIAVNDDGIVFNHEDLAASMWINEAELNGTAGQDDDGNGMIDDIYGFNFVMNIGTIVPGSHGTHVAGTIAAVNNNGIGVSGVAGGDGVNPGVRIMSCQIFSGNNSGGYADAFRYSADNGAVISQNSWETPVKSEALQTAVDYFIENAGMDENGNQEGPMAGGIVLVAAGNDNTIYPGYPAGFDNTIVVASMGPDYTKAAYSNLGGWVDLFAPGGIDERVAPYIPENAIYSTDLMSVNNGYSYQCGTSMACPHVSGIAGLVVSKYGVSQKGFTNEKLKDILISSARGEIYDLNPESYAGYLGTGLIDAGLALEADKGVAPGKVTVTTDPAFHSATLRWKVVKDQSGRAVRRYDIIYGKVDLKESDFISPGTGVEKATVEVSVALGEEVEFTADLLDASSTYNFGVSAIDAFGNRSQSTYISVTLPTNQAPEVVTPFEDIYFKTPGDYQSEVIDLKTRFTDPDGEDNRLTFTFTNSNEEVLLANMTRTFILTLVPNDYGTANVTVTCTDLEGAETEVTFRVVVGEEEPVDPPVTSDGKLVVWPNPVRDGSLYFIPGHGYDGNVSVRITNSMGRQVLKADYAASETSPARVDVGKLSGGTYTALFEYDGRKETRSFLKL